MPRYDDDGFRPVIEEILNDGPGPSAGPEDDTVLIFYGDAGMSQRPAETAVICIVSEGTVVRKMNRIDGADDAGFPRNIRQIRHDVEFIRNGDIGPGITFTAKALQFIGDVVAVHF